MADVEVMDFAVPAPEIGQLPPLLPLPSSSETVELSLPCDKILNEDPEAAVDGENEDISPVTSDKNRPKRLKPQPQSKKEEREKSKVSVHALTNDAVVSLQKGEVKELPKIQSSKREGDEINGIDACTAELPTPSHTGKSSYGKSSANVNAEANSNFSVPSHSRNRMKSPSTPSTIEKKSNLKRPRAGSETSELSAGTSSMSAKRIRIVENLDGKNCIKLKDSENAAALLPFVDKSTLTEVERCEEKLVWLNSGSSFIDQTVVNVDFVRENLTPAKRKFSVEIDMRFILSDTISAVLGSKTSIATIGPTDFHLWVARNSPYNNPKLKAVYKENFLKLANLDAILNFDLTSPKELIMEDNDGVTSGLYYIGELWHDSKGFREYLLTKTSQNAKQFSSKIFTWEINGPGTSLNVINRKTGILFQSKPLSSPLDRDEFPYLPTEIVEPFDREKSRDLLDLDVIDDFVGFITRRTNGVMLHTLISDNPEISYAYESCREIRFQKYFYCQCLLALRCIREGGTFVCKIFDTFTLFTNGLLFLLHKCFKTITMHKPSASSSYTSERFLICKGKVDNPDSKYAVDFLMDCFDMVVNNQKQMKIVRRRATKRLTVIRMEVQTLIPLKQILSHAEFFQYMRHTNIRLSMELAESIDQVCQYMEAGDEVELLTLSIALRKAHSTKLSLWNVPCIPMKDISPALTLEQNSIMNCEKFLTDNHHLQDISFNELKVENVSSVSELCASPLYESFTAFPIQGTGNNSVFKSIRGLFYGSGGSNILHFDGMHWHLLNYPEFSLPCDTLLLGEITEDVCLAGKVSKFVRTFHLFDGMFISGVFIGSTPLNKRQVILNRFLKSINNPTCHLNENCCVIPYLPVKELPVFYSNTSTDFSNIGYPVGIKCYDRCDKDRIIGLVGGFLLLRNIEEHSTPKNFFTNYQRFAWVWRQLDGDSGGGLEKLPEQCKHGDY